MKKMKFENKKSYNYDNLIQLLAKVDPEYLKGLSNILERPLEEFDSKDNENYNTDVISQRVDAGIAFLMEGGLTQAQALDTVKLLNDHMRHNGASEEDYSRLFEAIEEKNYSKAPYTQLIEADIRSQFILKTESTDTYETLFEELDKNIIDYMNKDQWEYVKKKIIIAQDRIRKEDLFFPHPVKGSEKGTLVEPTAQEKKIMGLRNDDIDFKLDKRKDNDDLLALKELVSLVKGKTAHPLTIGPGFFLKYLPEIINKSSNMETPNWEKNLNYSEAIAQMKFYQQNPQEQWDGISFKFDKENQLEKISLYKLPYWLTDHGTMLASLGLLYSQAYTDAQRIYELDFIYEDKKKPFITEEYKGNKKINNLDFFNDGSRYMILTHSFISTPENSNVLGYSSISKNTKVIKAAECYLFEKIGEHILNTRLYFYPYQPSQINPMLQHGSVIFGSNDQSFHTCDHPKQYLTEKDGKYIIKPAFRNFLLDWWKDKGNKYSFDSSILTGKLTELINSDGLPNSEIMTEDLLKPEYEYILINAIQGRYDFTDLSFHLATFKMISDLVTPYYFKDFKEIQLLNKNALPFSQRFAIWDYKENNRGISIPAMPTFLKSLAKEGLVNGNLKSYISVIKAQELTRLINTGLNHEEAYFQVYGIKK